ncbi:MAG TPA: phosphotransferase [Casimicrobiaceae bacterium]|nr:phosphotransferase [Casimicrobiaceae bacterium]
MNAVDARAAALSEWIASTLRCRSFSMTPASEDASFRRYFRIEPKTPFMGEPTLIAMDAPPPQEDCAPFVRVAGLLREAGVHAPRILAQDLAQGFLLVTDLGRVTYRAVLDESNADALFSDATSTLVRWQLATRMGALPDYDAPTLLRELEMFPEWYVARHRGIVLADDERTALSQVFALLIDDHLRQPQVFVHRDFMPRNLMVCEPNPGVLDFQDARIGPISYDVVCLFKDAFLSWPEERFLDWTIRYWQKAKQAALPVDADFSAFFRALEWMGLQRHLKVLGIFARLCYRDGKCNYVEDTPRFLDYVRPVARRYRELASLAKLIDRIDNVVPQVGYTF